MSLDPTTPDRPQRRSTDPTLPDRVTMPLLDLVTRDALDQDYVQEAQRRAGQGPAAPAPESGAPHRVRLRGAAVVSLVFGLMVALAAVQTARNADVDEASRDVLIDRIDQRKAEVDQLEERIDDVDELIGRLQTSAVRVGRQLTDAVADLEVLQISTGAVPVRGPGLRVTVSDNPDGSDDGRVRATDLRRLVNALWYAGAEAVAVNGRRLTGLSAIGQQGIAITVNRGPLSPPYVVSAIGEEDALDSISRSSTSGLLFDALAEQFWFVVDLQNEGELLLPAAGDAMLRLRYAAKPAPPTNANQEDVP